jgi:hypothetical protein
MAKRHPALDQRTQRCLRGPSLPVTLRNEPASAWCRRSQRSIETQKWIVRVSGRAPGEASIFIHKNNAERRAISVRGPWLHPQIERQRRVSWRWRPDEQMPWQLSGTSPLWPREPLQHALSLPAPSLPLLPLQVIRFVPWVFSLCCCCVWLQAQPLMQAGKVDGSVNAVQDDCLIRVPQAPPFRG